MAVRELIHDLENFLGRLAPKALFAGDAFQGQPAMIVTEDEIVLSGDKTTLVRVQPDGVQLSGNIALTATPEQIAIASYWRLNPLLLTCLASTTPTPIPTLVKSTPPLFEGRKQFDDGMQYLMGFSDAPEATTKSDVTDDVFFGATGEPLDEESPGSGGSGGSGGPSTAPNMLAVVESVERSGSWRLDEMYEDEPDGRGAFIEAVVNQLRGMDARWGHVRKNPGQNQYNGHAVDAINFKCDDETTAEIYDIVGGGGTPTWGYVNRSAANRKLWY